jgi:hypothetical protein
MGSCLTIDKEHSHQASSHSPVTHGPRLDEQRKPNRSSVQVQATTCHKRRLQPQANAKNGKKGQVKRKKAIPKILKKVVWDQTFGEDVGQATCPCCGHASIRQIEFACAHIVAEAMGGETIASNLLPVCTQCNLSMGTMNLQEFRATYFRARQ